MPPLLRMHHGIANRPRMEHGVRVHIDQIVKILGILRCHDVTRPVRIRERVQKRLKRPLQQLHERILRRVLATAAQHAVFEDVGNAGAVLRGSAEGDSEALVIVVGREGEQLGARLFVTVEYRGRAEFGNVVGFHDVEIGMFDGRDGVVRRCLDGAVQRRGGRRRRGTDRALESRGGSAPDGCSGGRAQVRHGGGVGEGSTATGTACGGGADAECGCAAADGGGEVRQEGHSS
mmetsp:Transcript_17361/g.37781  ORF Transcript_17361/g.37781 Transcript_17361/m.37781 type:complete len:233 (+) Transcript_17361:144-842(+)